MSRRPLTFALLFSLCVHALALGWRGWEASAPEPPGEAVRLEARFLPPPRVIARAAPPRPQPAPSAMQARPQPAPASQGAASSLPGSDVASSAPVLAGDEAGAGQSAPAEGGADVALRLPREGRVIFSGSAGGVVGLAAYGEASWRHDGVTLESRLAAGLSAPDSVLDFRSTSLLTGAQIQSQHSDDQRMAKRSTSQIDQAAGRVYLTRGSDRRERQIKGLAVALSALPQMLAMLDEATTKAAFFVVGDFWVEDSVLVALGEERLRLPVGMVDTRHYQSRTANDKLIDIWLAPGWHAAPVRIRIAFDGYTVDLRAAQVEIDGQQLASAPDALPPDMQ
ncbi:MAG: hypothetical protein REI09_09050 [Candidatus Dactylopiibacterium sp.]|nr:hypothetical protein [Candidatus Dactylopiibacterium sp.]